MATDDLAQQLDRLLPKSLDDIIRKNRELAKLYPTTDAEIDALRTAIPAKDLKGTISAWSFITMFLNDPGVARVFLTGFNEVELCSWMTSDVIAIDGDAVLTRNGSRYRLRGERSDSPDLLHVCATLHIWGLGKLLGVPHIFY